MDLAREWSSKTFKEKLWMLAGGMAFLLAVIGLARPIVPQVPFAILSAFFFSKGSPRIHEWMRNHPKMGPAIRDWEDHKVIGPKMKVISSLAIIAGAVLAWYRFYEVNLNVAFILVGVFLASLVFVVTRKSK
jgi:uncharacterized membrane protein YbaN (DUF454 family)